MNRQKKAEHHPEAALRRTGIVVSGHVQSVGFRMFIERHAKTMHLAGSVRNLHDGTVEIDVQGTEKRIEELIQLARQGPPRSKVTGLAIQERKPDAGLTRFNILF